MSEAEKYMSIVECVVNALEKVDSVTDMMAVVATSVDTWAVMKGIGMKEIENALDTIAKLAPFVHVVMEDGR